MAPKRPDPVESPPAASSSEDEDEVESSSEEETDQDEKKEGLASDDEVDPPVKKRPEATAPVAARNLNRKPEASESESESGSQTESESESEPERITNDAVKPLATKPTREPNKPRSDVVDLPANPAAKRPSTELGKEGKVSKPMGLPANSAAKRPSTEMGKEGNASKRAKKMEDVKKPDDSESKKTGEDSKKQLFQRLFSEEDEIALLRGMLEFTANNGDPYDHTDAFCEFVKKSINFNATRAQLFDKIRRLRKKFEKSVKKSVKMGKNGEDRVYSKAHDQKAFDLWKKIWGSDGALQSAQKSAKSKKNQGGSSKARVVLASPKRGEAKMEEDKEVVSNFAPVGCKNMGITGRDMASLLKMENDDGFNELAVMEGWDMVDGAKKRELEEKWKKIRAGQMELLLQRNEFIGEAARLIFEAVKANVAGFGH
ncbi:PREDICTED: GLABROUS1 enhancer-binding protein-like [Tarenaya hassleriana]|uniref:GLABROUS1 enhancer-binding protein-like n=1 Tax=Tarenaya hassleriana TaxID=28532 RepID=UPI00053C2F33|nr:PREDICTED: GLABROUS1 enhancer-binding protein-like [Tarenaya hassleriana]